MGIWDERCCYGLRAVQALNEWKSYSSDVPLLPLLFVILVLANSSGGSYEMRVQADSVIPDEASYHSAPSSVLKYSSTSHGVAGSYRLSFPLAWFCLGIFLDLKSRLAVLYQRLQCYGRVRWRSNYSERQDTIIVFSRLARPIEHSGTNRPVVVFGNRRLVLGTDIQAFLC